MKTRFRSRGTHKNTLDMFSVHFVKINFRFFPTPQKFSLPGFCVLPFLGRASTMQRHTSRTKLVAASDNFHENSRFRQHSAWQVHKSTPNTLQIHSPTHKSRLVLSPTRYRCPRFQIANFTKMCQNVLPGRPVRRTFVRSENPVSGASRNSKSSR